MMDDEDFTTAFGQPHYPSAEQGVRQILNVFLDRFDRGPGEALEPQDFIAPFSLPPLTPSAFGASMELAVERGWVETADGVNFRLTRQGLDAAAP